jgi:pimeloyl-ACP methyl ester carboxylesterase
VSEAEVTRTTRARLRAAPLAAGLLVALALGCDGRPPDGVTARGELASRLASRAPYPRVAGYLTCAGTGVQLWYERFGAADLPAVVLLNGGDSQAIFWPLEFVVALLDAGYGVVRYDPRDAGLSEWLPFPDGFDPGGWTPERPPPYGLDAHVDDVLGLLDGLGIARAHLVGVSQGAMVAQLAALGAPERVLTLTLLSTSPSNPYDAELGAVDPALLSYLREQAPRVGHAAALSFLLGGSRVVALQTDLLAEISGVGAADREALRLHLQESYDRAGVNAASSQGFAVASAASRLPALPRVAAPTLVLHGRDDRFIRPSHAEALARAIPGARLVWVDGGHGFPFQMFVARLDAILENLARPATPAR